MTAPQELELSGRPRASLFDQPVSRDRCEAGRRICSTYCADMIVEHFPDYENSAFVQEKFHENWSPDRTWGWQQNRAVVGHNLKIAWNLTRIAALKNDDRYTEDGYQDCGPDAGERHGSPTRGLVRRGGAPYRPARKSHRYAWHDRKAWWQQEQAILAYLILAGVHKKPEYVKLARESRRLLQRLVSRSGQRRHLLQRACQWHALFGGHRAR